MRITRFLAALATPGLLMASCGDGAATTTTPSTTVATTAAPTTTTTTTTPEVPPRVVTIADLVGSWTATSHTYLSTTGEQFDLIANGGETRTTVLDGGGARTWVTLGEFSDEWDAQLSFSGGLLVSTPVEEERGIRTFSITLEGDILTLIREDSAFDFSLAGTEPTSAVETVVFTRR